MKRRVTAKRTVCNLTASLFCDKENNYFLSDMTLSIKYNSRQITISVKRTLQGNCKQQNK